MLFLNARVTYSLTVALQAEEHELFGMACALSIDSTSFLATAQVLRILPRYVLMRVKAFAREDRFIEENV